jgi:hypothetical protein
VILAMFAAALWLVAAHFSRAALRGEARVVRSVFASMLGSVPGPASASISSPRPVAASTEGVRPPVAIDEASMRRRGVALMLDIGAIALVFLLVNGAIPRVAPPERATSIQQLAGLVVSTAGSAAYFLGSWLLGATPAMRLLRIVIVKRDGGAPGLVRAVIRLVVFAGEMLLIAFALLFYFGLGGHEAQEGLISWTTLLTPPAVAIVILLAIPPDWIPHDRIAGTRVVRPSPHRISERQATANGRR